jgi:hypothetical protein
MGKKITIVTTKIQMSFINSIARKGFHHEANGDFEIVTEFNGCDWRKLKMDQQHCSYSTILT